MPALRKRIATKNSGRPRDISQTTLAERSGISRRTIIKLEAGQANIRLSSLDHLAAALGSTFVEWVAPPTATKPDLDVVAWRGGVADSIAVVTASVPAHAEAQVWSWSLSAGDFYTAEPDPAGWYEIIVVTEGRLTLELEDGPSTLGIGEHILVASSQRCSSINNHEGTTRFVRTVIC